MDRFVIIFKQYRYGILVLLIGILLMLFPSAKDTPAETSQGTVTPQLTEAEALAEILSKIEGVGKAQVMLTIAMGEKTQYEAKEDSSLTADTETIRREPVIITDGNRTEHGLVRQVIPPEYRGAIVVCQGGGSPAVQLSVTEAVAAVTGLTADKISVRKMK